MYAVCISQNFINHPKHFVWLALLCLTSAACPTFEDNYTGTYREFEFAPEQDEVIAVDFFRFGTDAKAVIRYYNRSALSAVQTPFLPSNQTRCAWTQVDVFYEKNKEFSLQTLPSARRTRETLIGQINDDNIMALKIFEDGANTEPREVQLQLVEAQPNAECENINDFLIRPDFQLDTNYLPPETYQIENPVFAVIWVGVEPVQRDGVVVYVAFNRPEPTTRLESGRHFSPTQNSLQGTLSLSIPPPDERMLVRSGSTRYALAHFVVIDDSDAEGRFSWDITNEPIVASALQRGIRHDAPEESNGWGRALLFVEGQLDELDINLKRNIEGIENAADIADSHFFIVDVFFYNDEIIRVRMPEDPLRRRVPIQTTDYYLNTDEILLPRLFPYQ